MADDVSYEDDEMEAMIVGPKLICRVVLVVGNFVS